MGYAIQLDFFVKKDDFSILTKEMESVRNECSSVRKGVFSRLDLIKKEILDTMQKQQEEIELLKVQLLIHDKNTR